MSNGQCLYRGFLFKVSFMIQFWFIVVCCDINTRKLLYNSCVFKHRDDAESWLSDLKSQEKIDKKGVDFDIQAIEVQL